MSQISWEDMVADKDNIINTHDWSQVSQETVASFGDEGDFTRRHLLNPVIFELLGDVAGKTILDAGCGQGYLSRLLARRGAVVTGIEQAHPWYSYAAERERSESLGIDYIQADLSVWAGLPESFDYAVANMVLMDIIPDFRPALHTCVASLKPKGGLIISLLHPCFEEPGAVWQEKGYVEIRDYFQERSVAQTYGHFNHRPMSTYLNSVIDEGCQLQRIIEPQLEEDVARQYHAERYWHVPGYLVIYATKS